MPEASRSLYLRWRPKRFGDVIAQDHVTRTLRNAVARGTVTHAYLLCGPRGTGKTSIARILYRAINCLEPIDGEPCGSCTSCKAADEGRAVDLIEMDAASHGGIDDVRDLRERVYFAPVDAKTKVYIVDEAHQLTARAWDAFLKTLEEPPPRTVFVLATTEAHRVPATIVSRCQRFDLRRIPRGGLEKQLESIARSEGIVLDSGVAERLARLAQGSLRDGESMLEQVAAFGGRSVSMEAARTVLGLVRGDALRAYLDALSVGDSARGLELLEQISEEGADLRQFLDEVVFYLRGALLARSGAGPSLEIQFGHDERVWLEELATRWAPGQVLGMLRSFSEIDSRGRDEHHVLVRAELVTAWAAGLIEATWRGPTPEKEPWEGPSAVLVSAHPSRGQAAEAGGLPVDASAPNELLAGVRHAEAEALREPDSPTALSLAVVQAEWPRIADNFQGSLLIKVRLRGVQPVALQENVVTLGGELDLLDLQKLEAPECRASIEAAFAAAFRVPLKIRFAATEGTAAGGETQVRDEGPSALAELGTSLFGGTLLPEA